MGKRDSEGPSEEEVKEAKERVWKRVEKVIKEETDKHPERKRDHN